MTADPNVIQLAPGVAIIMSIQEGMLQVETAVVAKSRRADYDSFAELSARHIRKVMSFNAFKWSGL